MDADDATESEQIQIMLGLCRMNKTSLLSYDLRNGMHPNCQDETTLSSLLHVACRMGSVDCVCLLLQFKADPNIVNKEGKTPLHEACMSNKPECLWYLMELENTNIMAMDKEGNTPLHYACRAGASECTRLLLAHKDVMVNSTNARGWTPLHMACLYEEGSICPFLLLENGADTSIQDDMGYTPLAIATVIGYPSFVRTLLEHDADPNISDQLGRTPLYLACYYWYSSCVRILVNHKDVDIHKPRINGRTPLHEAIRDSEGVSARLLLEKGADLFQEDHNGETPLTISRKNKAPVIIELLEEYTNKEDGRKRERSEDDDEVEEPSAKRGRNV